MFFSPWPQRFPGFRLTRWPTLGLALSSIRKEMFTSPTADTESERLINKAS